ncbi:MAG: 50S ribosomal protein L18 [Candidatus Goldiibacteriota bacterium]
MKIKKKASKTGMKKILRKARGRKKSEGTPQRPRLNIFRGTTSLYAQVIDDSTGKTLLGIATNNKDASVKGKNKAAAENLGKLIAEKCKEKNIETVVFDRGGGKYHGVIKVFADSVREGGIKF